MTSVELVGDWQLSVDGSVGHGHCSLVVAVRSTSGRPAVLKVGYPDAESEHEPLALQHWHGDGAVQLLRADPHRRALLLERLHDESLVELWDEEACQVGIATACTSRRLPSCGDCPAAPTRTAHATGPCWGRCSTRSELEEAEPDRGWITGSITIAKAVQE